MGEGSRARWVGSVLAAAWLLGSATGASAFEFLDGRVQVHGFYEAQVRSIARDYQESDGWDLTQWYHVLNVEVDWDIAPDGVGPFDLVSAFGRVEARYDCVWSHACWMFPGANAYGSRSRNGRIPKRLRDGSRSGFEFAVFSGDTAPYHSRDRFTAQNRYDSAIDPVTGQPVGLLGIGNRSPRGVPVKFDSVPGISTLMGTTGPDAILGTADDPGPFFFSMIYPDCRFGIRDVDGNVFGVGTQTLVHTVNKADCKIRPNGSMRTKPNPFNPNDADPTRPVLPNGGAFAQPYRPAPLYSILDAAPENQAVGVFYPNANLRGNVGDLDHTDQNFRQSELAWNRGASQDEKELKELFVEFEMFDSRLWIRAGKQQIVWGKTELFRTTDQFNPQDLALGSLTSLEESRIALWSARGVWSFYEVGPLEDVRLELALNYDDIEPADLGRCGEPYTPLPACDLTFGMMAHGIAGVAIAGYDRPEDPWDDLSGIEVGARLEWRWGRFSMALIDFYGYDDSFWIDQNFRYSRNVDPVSGRPRHTVADGPCPTGAEASCLVGIPLGPMLEPPAFPDVVPIGVVAGPGQTQLPPNNALQFHSVNQQIFAMICATSIGFSDLDRSSCAQSVFNSQAKTTGATSVTIATAVSNLLAGDATGLVFGGLLGVPLPGGPCDPTDLPDPSVAGDPGTLCNPLIPLSNDVTGSGVDLDGPFLTFAEAAAAGLTPTPTDGILYRAGVQGMLTDEQQALLGCGPFYGTFCDGHGIDLLNAEASALLQSLVGYEGTGPVLTVGLGPFTTDPYPTFTQPGTVGFVGGPICTRFERGRRFILPGCRGLTSVGADGVPDGIDDILAGTGDDTFDTIDGVVVYDPTQDGTTTGAGPTGLPFARAQPFLGRTPGCAVFSCATTGDYFKSEMATLSWNAVMALVALSSPPTMVDTTGDGMPDFATDVNGDGWADRQFIAQDEFDITRPFRPDGCSYAAPGLCSNVRAIGSVTGVTRAIVRAGGNGQFGRRDFVWHGGSEVVLRFDKRNVLGFSMDFAEDVTKTNWGMEFTWIPNLPTGNNGEIDGISETDQFNLTIAVDRPTFINFLNQNRTFFITTQWFMRYTKDYEHSMPGQGPWSALAILNVSSGYFQDRLLPGVTFVYDFRSNSGAVLPSVGYRFTENFSATFGLAIFSGRTEERTPALTPISLGNRVGKGAYSAHVDRGLSLIRERDEVFLRVRYTF